MTANFLVNFRYVVCRGAGFLYSFDKGKLQDSVQTCGRWTRLMLI
jgi:hypothetical protein